MCYHRRLHFILCNHVYDLEIVRPCALALADEAAESSPRSSGSRRFHSSDAGSSTSGSTASAERCYPMVHPWTTYKVRRVCGACVARRERLDERIREVREELERVRGSMVERRLVREERERSEAEGDGEEDVDEMREGNGDGEWEDEMR